MIDYYQLVVNETLSLLQEKGVVDITVQPDSQFFRDLTMDSLDLATLIVNLEQKAGFDPFRAGFVTFATVRELANLYQGQVQ
jgi:acyl carrier protein